MTNQSEIDKISSSLMEVQEKIFSALDLQRELDIRISEENFSDPNAELLISTMIYRYSTQERSIAALKQASKTLKTRLATLEK